MNCIVHGGMSSDQKTAMDTIEETVQHASFNAGGSATRELLQQAIYVLKTGSDSPGSPDKPGKKFRAARPTRREQLNEAPVSKISKPISKQRGRKKQKSRMTRPKGWTREKEGDQSATGANLQPLVMKEMNFGVAEAYPISTGLIKEDDKYGSPFPGVYGLFWPG